MGDEAARRLLKAYLELFRHALEAWPAGILAEGARADLPRCQRMLGEVRQARALDADGIHSGYLNEVETKIRIEIGQLRSDEGRCFF